MSYEQAEKNIRAHFITQWSGAPVTYDNDPDFYNGSVKTAKPSNSPWVRFGVRDNFASQPSFGASDRHYRRFGIVFVQIFVPENTNTTEAMALADTAASAFDGDNQRISTGERFEPPVVTVVGVNDGWFQVNVSIDFQYDYFK